MDTLVKKGLKLICAKVVDLLSATERINIDLYTEETRCTHQEWISQLQSVY